jgi:phage shock protein C
MTKKLYKSDTDKVLAGVIGGLGEYLDMDPTILRLAYILITVLTGVVPAIVAYFIAVLVVPNKPAVHHINQTEHHS